MIVKSNLPKLFKADALCIAPFIFVRPECASDSALIAHEMVHYKEQVAVLVIPWWIRYLCSRKFRLLAELRAYSKQIALKGIYLERAAYLISTNYRLNISLAEAKEALKTMDLLNKNVS